MWKKLSEYLGGTLTDAGKEIWRFTEASNGFYSSPTIVDNTVYIGSGFPGDEDGRVYAVDASTGRKRWEFTDLCGPIVSSPIVIVKSGSSEGHDNKIVDHILVKSADGTLYGLDEETGECMWQLSVGEGNPGVTSPTVSEGVVYTTGEPEGTVLYAVELSTLDRKWKFKTPSDDATGTTKNLSTPIVTNETVYIHNGSSVYAVDPETGKQRWTFTECSDPIGLTVSDGTVYALTAHGKLYTLSSETGEKVASTVSISGETELKHSEDEDLPQMTHLRSHPTVSGGTVYVRYGSRLYAIGNEVSFDTELSGEYGFSSPTVSGGTVCVGADGLHAIDASTGERKWEFTDSSTVYSSPTVVDGIVYFADNDGGDSILYALDTGVEGSSEDSRVELGTLGHHDTYTPKTTQQKDS